MQCTFLRQQIFGDLIGPKKYVVGSEQRNGIEVSVLL